MQRGTGGSVRRGSCERMRGCLVIPPWQRTSLHPHSIQQVCACLPSALSLDHLLPLKYLITSCVRSADMLAALASGQSVCVGVCVCVGPCGCFGCQCYGSAPIKAPSIIVINN